MKLSLPAIIERLNQLYPVIDYNIENDENIVQSILFANPDFAGKHCVLHVCPADTEQLFIPKVPDSALLCIGELPSSFEKEHVNYICLAESSDPQDVYNALSLTLEELRCWEDHIYDLFIAGKSLQEIFEASTEYTNNPIYLHDANYRILAYAERKSSPATQKSYPWLRDGKMPPEAVIGLLKSPKFEETFSTTHATYWEKTAIYPDEYNYIYCNIKTNDKFMGRIFMDERNRPFRQIDYVIVDKLAEIVTKLCQTKKLATDYHLDYIADSFCSLLDNELKNQNDFIASLSEIGWNSSDHYICITIPLSKSDFRRHIAGSVLNMVEQAFAHCYTIEYKKNIVAILNTESTMNYDRPHLCMQLFPVIRDFHLHAFVSNEFTDILELPEHYKLNSHYQTKLEKQAKDLGEPNIYFFEEHLMDYILDTLSGQCPPHILYPQPLRAIIAYDKENNTDYASTLRTYLENDCSPAAASQALFIHRSTFRYRFEKLNEIASINFSDPVLRTHLLLAFLLIDKIADTPKNPN